MKKLIGILLVMAFVLSCTGCVGRTGTRGGATISEDAFHAEYNPFNTTKSYDLTAKTGDSIHGQITVDKGNMSVVIQDEKKEIIYENKNFSVSSEFDVEVQEDGRYTVTLEGEKAVVKADFTVEKAEK